MRSHTTFLRLSIALVIAAIIPLTAAAAQPSEVTAQAKVRVTGAAKASEHHSNEGVVLWLTPVDAPPPPSNASRNHLQLAQKNKQFTPHLLVVQVGSIVEFPNLDPFFHNVFSQFNGKRFDLGLYESGSSRSVHFDRPGVSYIFCNIHPEMSAVIITMGTPLYATASDDGLVSISNVPYGRYTLHAWSEGLGPDDPPETKEITIGDGSLSLGVIPIHPASGPRILHKNKYGRDYDEPTPGTAIYPQR